MSAVLNETKTASLAELRRPQAPEAQLPAVRAGWDNLQGFELMQRAAKALAASTLVPAQYQGNVPNSLIALEMANRIGASPLMVTQNLYIVHGRPAWSAKFLIATFNQCGKFSALRYEWEGERGSDKWGCRAWAIEKATGEKITGPLISIGLAKQEGWYSKNGSKWQTIPELMLTYRAAAWLVNTHAPELSMGLNTAEEMHDVFDATPDESGKFTVTAEQLREEMVGVTDIVRGQSPQPEPQPEPPPAPSGSPFEDAMSLIKRASETGDIETAATLLDDAQGLAGSLPKKQAQRIFEDIAKAKAAIRG